MSIAAIQSVLQQLQATAQIAGSQEPSASGVVSGGGFADEMKKTLERISNAQQHAAGQAEAFELGKPGVALNDVMIDLQKANVGFQMGLQVRNKLVAAYQEIINLPA
ncbi:flagellar hook-basal body complex protein FliE [Paraherbaspirillum soli]|uniref:Flagellar hook-basal body complex protein FliE n=1 Tax=Paraherbaspirillum soli TaxID=631222 RepID=A0ABW0MCQ5_9BURK